MDIAMRELVADRIEALQRLDLASIKSLPARTREVLSTRSKIAVIRHHDVTETGDHRVVVQAVRQRWLGLFTAIEVDGFVAAPDGTRRPLAEKEKWPFI